MDVLFWSGGKDSYLALEFYTQEYGDKENVKLLTTYEQETEVVPHQNIPLDNIKRQAEQLGIDLISVPLPKDCSNEVYLAQVEEALADEQESIEQLVFGDWQLEDIREWREKVFGEMGYSCLFPIWHKSLHDLLPY